MNSSTRSDTEFQLIMVWILTVCALGVASSLWPVVGQVAEIVVGVIVGLIVLVAVGRGLRTLWSRRAFDRECRRLFGPLPPSAPAEEALAGLRALLVCQRCHYGYEPAGGEDWTTADVRCLANGCPDCGDWLLLVQTLDHRYPQPPSNGNPQR